MSLWSLESMGEVRSQSWPGCPMEGHGLIPCWGDMVNCSSRLSVLLPNCFSSALTPLGSYWWSNKHPVCLLVQSSSSWPWIHVLVLTGTRVREKLSGLFWYASISTFFVVVGLPDFILHFHSKLPCEIIPSSVKMLTNASTVTEQRHYSWKFSVCFMWFIENAHYKTENTF